MESDQSDAGDYNKEFLSRVYESLLKTGNNISLAELNTSEPVAESSTHPNVLTLDNQSQIRQTVKIIQSNGAPRTESLVTGQASVSKVRPGAGVSLLQKQYKKESSILGIKKKQAGGSKGRRTPSSATYDPYYHKWKHLKKYVKNMVFMNAAICDEVVRQEEKVAKSREERRFLLRKLLHYQTMADAHPITGKHVSASLLKSSTGEELPSGTKTKAKKKSNPQSGDKGKQPREVLESLGMKPKPKKSKLSGGKHIVPPIPLDTIGRPIFPLVIGDLTVHSIGEIVADRSGFHTSNSIFPVGYCSTRVYANLINPEKQCLYTCKITDSANGPMFEIVPEDNSKTFRSRFVSECHSQLLRALNQARGTKLVETTGKGPDFFGLSHPVVQNLIQSCPGAKKCNGYKWVKFEVNKNLSMDNIPAMFEDVAISHSILKQKLAGVLDQSPSNLRTLLSGSIMDTNTLKT